MSVREAIDALAGYVEFELEEGRTEIRVAPGTEFNLRPAPSGPAAQAPDTDTVETLADLAAEIADCTKCPLHKARKNTVPGQGCANPEILFVGEGPGAEEDKQGLPFVGAAGELLTRMIEAMGLKRDQVFIANIVKCRPPGNRTPHPDEMSACLPYLMRQIKILKPGVIVALGGTAIKGLTGTKQGITRLRGTWMDFEGIDLMPTFHPAYLLHTPDPTGAKRQVWDDLKQVLHRLDKPVPERKKPSVGTATEPSQ